MGKFIEQMLKNVEVNGKKQDLSKHASTAKKLIVVAILLILGAISGFVVAYRSSAQTINMTVNEVAPRIVQESTYSHLVYTDKGVYTNKDSLSFLKFRSSDIYNQLRAGGTYNCKVAGWRIGFFSMYRNIIDCEGFKYE